MILDPARQCLVSICGHKGTSACAPKRKECFQPAWGRSHLCGPDVCSDRTNAQMLTSKLSAFGPVRMTPVQVGSQLFYRVRVGPMATVDQADQVLQQVIHSGQTEARIVVD